MTMNSTGMNRIGANSSRPGPAATQSAAGSAASPVAVTEAGWLMSDRGVLVLAGAAGLGAWLAWPVPLLIAVAGLVTVVLVPRWRQVFTLAAALTLLTAALADRAYAGLDPAFSGPVAGAAVLVSDPERLVAGTRAVAVFDGQRVQLWAHGAPAAALRRGLAGDVVEFQGRRRGLEPERIQANPWRRVVGIVEVQQVDRVGPGHWLHRLANEIHRRLEIGARSLPAEDRALLAGLVLGDDRAQPPLLRDAFDAVGLSHLLAVSGQNVAFVLAAAGPALRRLRLSSRWLAVVVLLCFFATVTRFEPSVLRAVAMAMLASTATALGRPAPGLRVLALAVVALLLIDPLLVRSLGFQLSVVASAGILVLAPPLASRLPLPAWLATAVAVPLAAQLATSPLLVARNGSIPAVALVANVLAGPAAGMVMTWGSSAGLLAGWLPGPLATLVSLPNLILLRWISTVALMCARLAPWTLGGPTLAALLGAAAVVQLRHSQIRGHPASSEADLTDLEGPSSPPRSRRALRRVAALLAGAALLMVPTLRGAPTAGWGANLPAGVDLHRWAGDEVVVITRPVEPSALLRALRGRIDGKIELVVVTSTSDGAWRSAALLRQRFGAEVVLAPLARPGAQLAAPGQRLEVGQLQVEVVPNPSTGGQNVLVSGDEDVPP